jgi:hypothetical protein
MIEARYRRNPEVRRPPAREIDWQPHGGEPVRLSGRPELACKIRCSTCLSSLVSFASLAARPGAVETTLQEAITTLGELLGKPAEQASRSSGGCLLGTGVHRPIALEHVCPRS